MPRGRRDRAEILGQHFAAVHVVDDVREELALDVLVLDRTAAQKSREIVAALPPDSEAPGGGAIRAIRRDVVWELEDPGRGHARCRELLVGRDEPMLSPSDGGVCRQWPDVLRLAA